MLRVFLLVICLAVPAGGQQVATPPPEDTRPHLSIFTGSHYSMIPSEAALVEAFKTDPSLLRVRNEANFHHYTDRDPLYKARYAKVVPLDRFPAILLQRADGGFVYKATGSNVPSSPPEIFEEMAHYAKLDPLTTPADSKESRPWRPWQTWQARELALKRLDSGIPDVDGPPQDCPDGNCPVPSGPNDTPPSLEPNTAPPDSTELGGPRTPIRNMAAAAVFVVGIVAAAGLCLFGLLLLVVVVYLLSKAFR